MSTHVIGLRPPTENYKKKLAAWQACMAADVEPPQELRDYFNDEREPNPDGMEVAIEDTDAVTKYDGDMEQGFDVDISELPEGVTIIRFYNSY